MAVQQQMSSFAKKLGARVAEANAEHAGKPIELGRKQLPPGINNGIARLSSMYTKESEKDDGVCPKGETFFRASAIVIKPDECAGAVTSIVIPLCDMPEKGNRKAVSFSENFNTFRSLFEALGIAPFPEPPIDSKKDPAGAAAQGMRIEAYFMAAMKGLTDPVRMKNNPVYISFSTRGWTPPKTPIKPNPTEMVFEYWNGKADFTGKPDPAAGVRDSSAPPSAPSGNGSAPPKPPTRAVAAAAPAPEPAQPPKAEEADPVDVVTALIEVAMNDPEQATDDGADAAAKLEAMAIAAGWPAEEVGAASDWAAVGDMALNPPQKAEATEPDTTPSVTVGSKWMFCKRDKTGSKLKDAKGNEFPPIEVEVTTVDEATKTCAVKNIKDGKDIVDIRTKKPVAVKWEWLEVAPLY